MYLLLYACGNQESTEDQVSAINCIDDPNNESIGIGRIYVPNILIHNELGSNNSKLRVFTSYKNIIVKSFKIYKDKSALP